MLSPRDSLWIQSLEQGESEQREKILHTKSNQERPEVATPVSNKTDFKIKIMTEDKQYIKSTHQ